MMLYLTGGSTSLSKTSEVPQDDPMKSLGGYVSSSPVPNASLNAIFDCISLQTLKTKPKETVAIALVNKFDKAVNNVYIRTVISPENIGIIRVAAVAIGEEMAMEHIPNRYAEPINAEFVDVSYIKAFVDFEIKNPVKVGDDIFFEQFNVLAEITEPEIEGNAKALIKAFSNNKEYELKRLSERRFRVVKKEDTTAVTPFLPTYISSDEDADYHFLSEFKETVNTAFLTDTLEPNGAIGIWIQRDITEVKERTNEEIIRDYDEKRHTDTVEEIELVIDYDETE